MPRCPSCEAELRYLSFYANTTGTEWGTENFPLNEGCRDYDDHETSDSYDCVYSCPECDYELSPNEIQDISDTYERENPTQNNRPRENIGFPRRLQIETEPATECPHCHHIYQDTLTHEMICPRCNKIWSPPEKEIKNIKINNINNNP